MKNKYIHNMNDFVLGLAFLALGLFCLLNPNIASETMHKLGGTLAKASTYIRLLGFILTAAAAVLMICAVAVRNKPAVGIPFSITTEGLITAIALVVYCFVMPIISFFPATFIMVMGLNLLFKRKENIAAGTQPITKEAKIKSLLHSALYSAIITVLFWVVFTQLLTAVLP